MGNMHYAWAIPAFLAVAAAAPVSAGGAPATFEVHPVSSATLILEGPLVTLVGRTRGPGHVSGSVTVDPDTPEIATGAIKVDLAAVTTGIERVDSELATRLLEWRTNPECRWAVFELKRASIPGALESWRAASGTADGLLTVRRVRAPMTAELRVTYLRFGPMDALVQKLSAVGAEVLRVQVWSRTAFSRHGMPAALRDGPPIGDEVQLQADLTLVRQ